MGEAIIARDQWLATCREHPAGLASARWPNGSAEEVSVWAVIHEDERGERKTLCAMAGATYAFCALTIDGERKHYRVQLDEDGLLPLPRRTCTANTPPR